ncbi:GNAT family N-acetyltransferase [Sulfitobacter delicatus]|uniref:Acetyltransferase, GNAT family n=1 Tax=Sulfitobacter delicatus TaxID=218672 RepID=A0A1G7HZZ5_9RHOB|nr:GNAT family N-acetyltransferase [Sulfitobacter delicatus]SDF05958.1 Acetyltransferase, GNAT family [Sulfitobacter delicatus]
MGEGGLTLRAAGGADYDSLGQVMFDAIHAGTSVYSAAERRAWLDAPPTGARWAAKLAGQQVVLAEREGAVIGFMTLAAGHIDLAFVAAKAQGQGVFRALYAQVERQAQTQGETRLHAHASLMARPAFEAVGFHVIRAERVARAGEYLDRFEMEKTLT